MQSKVLLNILTTLMTTSSLPVPRKRLPAPISDTLITKKSNSSIKVSLYCKATHTDRYLNFQSHHPLEHKISVVQTLTHRAETTVTEPSDLAVEKDHVKSALKNCGLSELGFSQTVIGSLIALLKSTKGSL